MTVLRLHQLSHRLVPSDPDPVDDATLAASIEKVIQMEQAAVDADLAAGRNLIVNTTEGSKRIVHRAECPSVSHYLDRRLSWFPWGWGLAELRVQMRHGGFEPKMPVLAAEPELDQLNSYRACRTCQPALKRAEKVYVANRTSNPNNLTERHIGRTFTAEGADAPFTLAKIERTISADGITTVLHAQEGPVPLVEGARVMMLPRERIQQDIEG